MKITQTEILRSNCAKKCHETNMTAVSQKIFIECRYDYIFKKYIFSAIIMVKNQFKVFDQIWSKHFLGLKKIQKNMPNGRINSSPSKYDINL